MAQQNKAGDNAFELRKSTIGIRMTVLYAIVYGGFVALNVFQPTLMGTRVFLGLNLAVAYGIGLIIIAIIFALVYNQLCRVKTVVQQDEKSSLIEVGKDAPEKKK